MNVVATACICGISPTRGVVANAIHDDSIKSPQFISFMKRLKKAYGDEPFIMYFDQLRVHTSILCEQHMRENGLTYILAPGYSPLL